MSTSSCAFSVLLLGFHNNDLSRSNFIDGGFDRLFRDDDSALLGLRRNLARPLGDGNHQRIAAFMVGSELINRRIKHKYTTFPSV